MAQESRITIVTPLPDDIFERAKMLTEIKPALEALVNSLPSPSSVKHEIVTPRGDRVKTRTRRQKIAE